MTLKFETKENFCQRHKKSVKSKQNKFWSCFSRKKNTSNGFDAKRIGIDSGSNLPKTDGTNRMMNSNRVQNSEQTDQNMVIDDLNSNCILCLAENNKFSQSHQTIEDLYNQQPVRMFKYYIGMCSLIFISIATVLLVSDLKKYKQKMIYFF